MISCRCNLGLLCKFIFDKDSYKYGKLVSGNLIHDKGLVIKSEKLVSGNLIYDKGLVTKFAQASAHPQTML